MAQTSIYETVIPEKTLSNDVVLHIKSTSPLLDFPLAVTKNQVPESFVPTSSSVITTIFIFFPSLLHQSRFPSPPAHVSSYAKRTKTKNHSSHGTNHIPRQLISISISTSTTSNSIPRTLSYPTSRTTMMGFDNQEDSDESHLHASQEHMETLLLHDDPSPASAAGDHHTRFSDPLSLPFAEISTDDYDYPPSSSPPSISQPPNPNPNPNPNLNLNLNLNSSSFNSILEPPSYADAVFRSFDRDQINGHDHTSSPDEPSTLPSRRSEYIRISVSDPQKELELSNSLVPGSNTYHTYLVTTRTNLREFGGKLVRRRPGGPAGDGIVVDADSAAPLEGEGEGSEGQGEEREQEEEL